MRPRLCCPPSRTLLPACSLCHHFPIAWRRAPCLPLAMTSNPSGTLPALRCMCLLILLHMGILMLLAEVLLRLMLLLVVLLGLMIRGVWIHVMCMRRSGGSRSRMPMRFCAWVHCLLIPSGAYVGGLLRVCAVSCYMATAILCLASTRRPLLLRMQRLLLVPVMHLLLWLHSVVVSRISGLRVALNANVACTTTLGCGSAMLVIRHSCAMLRSIRASRSSIVGMVVVRVQLAMLASCGITRLLIRCACVAGLSAMLLPVRCGGARSASMPMAT
jgi:hypothetical protein